MQKDYDINYVNLLIFSLFSAYYPEVPLLEVPQTRPGSSLSNWVKKHSPQIPSKSPELIDDNIKDEAEYDMDVEQVGLISNFSLHFNKVSNEAEMQENIWMC